ncbi:MAG: hypothetical protein ACOVT5_01405 [Armatimonadaceae bacterium]
MTNSQRRGTRAQPLSVTPLTDHAVALLCERGLRKHDTEECYIAGRSPCAALKERLTGHGPSYAVWGLVDGYPKPVGAIGIATDPWNPTAAAIWSLWTDDLDGAMKRCIFRNTRDWVVRLMDEAGVNYAANYVLDTNRLAVRWIKSSGCFHLNERTHKVGEAGRHMRYFWTRTLSELTRV